ncbi:hypothetical protein BE21_40500 [Sorangium cellulosum]|uniref:DUF418 domain-containing protein n=1 Tax=Sorangium cellulosum TaxID=56 RepID=A0A150TLJ4_SORCE|nr:hypothetical protein BE21_40500 [Sorangium cellulosum]
MRVTSMDLSHHHRALTDVASRSLAPDLARGFMLLPIAVAHAPAFVSHWDLGPAALNALAAFARSLFAENQARAMFVFLFGYALGQSTQRQHARGSDWASIRELLRRRGLWLMVIGFAHAALLVPLDIVAVYGLTLLLLAPLVRSRDSSLGWTSAVTLVPATLLLSWQSVTAQTAAAMGEPMTLAPIMAPDYVAHVLAGLPFWPLKTAVSTVVVVPGMLPGIWAARRRLLDEPERHAPLLWRVAAIGMAVSLFGRLPMALMLIGAWTTSMTWTVAGAHALTGYAGGIGMAAAAGLVAIGVGRNQGPLTTALAALGQRSLTFYLFQSAVWLALFYPFTLDLRDDMGFAASCAVAVVLWIASILLADGMRRAGHRGPAEVLLRRLSYRRIEPARVSSSPHG